MKKILLIGAIAAACWSGPSTAGGDVIAISVNKANTSSKLDQGDLRPIFQTSKTTWPNGDKIIALNLPEEDLMRKGVDAAVMGLDPERVARYWVDRKIRGGNAPPKKIPSVGAMLKLVGSQAGAIGYVSAGEVSGDVKVIAKIKDGQVVAP